MTVAGIISGMREASQPSRYWIANSHELEPLYDSRLVIQRNGQSVFSHTMDVIDLLRDKTAVSLLSGLFHDLGKCELLGGHKRSSHKFPSHADVSAEIARKQLAEWSAEQSISDSVVRIVKTHMYDIRCCNNMAVKTIRKFVANVGMHNIEDWFYLREADCLSYGPLQPSHNHLLRSFRSKVDRYVSSQLNDDQPKYVSHRKNGGFNINREGN